MSAFNAKNLSYNKQEPSFLRKLRAEHGGDRSNVQFARPKKDRLKTGDDDEDEPTIVDEHGENLGKAEWEEMLNKEKAGASEEKDEQDGGDKGGKDGVEEIDLSREKQQVAEIGTTKKRKAVKVIAEDSAADEKGEEPQGTKKAQEKATSSTIKKKTKKVKLSFDDPDDG